MKDIFRKLHLWVSVPFGIVIVITCFTGALLVFESDIVALRNRDLIRVEPVGAPLSVEQLIDKVNVTLKDGAEVTGVVIPSSPFEAYKVNVSKPSRTALYVDQYTGAVKGKHANVPFFSVVRRLHRWLMDARPSGGGIFWGKMVVGASTLAFVVILLTGLVIWWPRNGKMLKNRLKIVAGKGWNRFWHNLHVAGGFYVLLFLLAMALTGLTWSYSWYRNAFYSLFDAETAQSTQLQSADKPGVSVVPVAQQRVDTLAHSTTAVDGAVPETDAVTAATWKADAATAATVLADEEPSVQPWQRAFDCVVAKYARYKTVTVTDGLVTVALEGFGNERVRDKYVFDESTGEIISEKLYANESTRSKASGWVRMLHFGTWGGVFSKVLYFLAALLGATLPVTGYYLWIRRLYGKRMRN